MAKLIWEVLRGAFVILAVTGVVFIAVTTFVISTTSYDLDQYEHQSISSIRKLGKGSRLDWSYSITNSFFSSVSAPIVTIMILTNDNYHLLLENDSSAIINYKLESFQKSDEGVFKIPFKDTWVIVYNNTNRAFYFEEFFDGFTDYTIETKANFYNLSLSLSLVFSIAFSSILVFIVPFIYDNVSSRKQSRLEEEKQEEENTREIIFKSEDFQERVDLLNSIRLYYDRLPTHILMHILRFDSLRELMVFKETLSSELRFAFDGSEAVFLKNKTINIEEKPVSQPVIANLSTDNKYLCSSCGKEVSYKLTKCPNCGEIVRCVVCKLQIEPNEQKCKCPLCETVGHLIHFHLWIEGVKKCPFCRGKLSISDIILLKE